MPDSLQTILDGHDWGPPPEFQAIKQYVLDHFKTAVEVGLQDNKILIKAPNGALAGMLRLHIEDIRTYAKTDKPLIIRIG